MSYFLWSLKFPLPMGMADRWGWVQVLTDMCGGGSHRASCPMSWMLCSVSDLRPRKVWVSGPGWCWCKHAAGMETAGGTGSAGVMLLDLLFLSLCPLLASALPAVLAGLWHQFYPDAFPCPYCTYLQSSPVSRSSSCPCSVSGQMKWGGDIPHKVCDKTAFLKIKLGPTSDSFLQLDNPYCLS